MCRSPLYLPRGARGPTPLTAQNQRPPGGPPLRPVAQSRPPAAGLPHMAVSLLNSACPRSPRTCTAESGRREPSRSRSYTPSESTRARVQVRSAGAPGVDPTTQGGHPRGQAARRSTAGRLDYLAPASPDKKAPSNPGSPLVPPGPPRRCTAGSGSPGALRGRPRHNLVGPRGARAPRRGADELLLS
ncbi:hypothetical protein NDU88_003896 [Pleurodeles waltl]|uniref:Uncharacterized protein n=1 Tax=Pleurodeles waltl TaxID=8319 RepID=A0AAV7MUT2_PLEWA|nr:hypothetical protein NDU88_003896 [Pleurodeles waltl]